MRSLLTSHLRPKRLLLKQLLSLPLLLLLAVHPASGQNRAGDAGRRHVAAVRAQRTWPDERKTGVFYCHSDHSLADYERMLDRLGVLQLDLQRVLEVESPREQVHLFLFEHIETYNAYVRMYFPDAPKRRALYVKDGRGPGMVFAALNEEIEIDIRHEGTHALLHTVLPMVPLWLDEGLAEYFEQKQSKRVHSSPHLSKMKWNVRFRSFAAIESLESIQRLDQMGAGEYRNAWAWVHFMLHGPKPLREELKAYLRDIQSHAAPGKLSERLRRRVPDLNDQFVKHFLAWEKK